VVATNYHVIKNAKAVYVRIVKHEKVYAVTGVVGADEEKDLALLSVEGVEAKPLPLGDSGTVVEGDAVYALGNPQGLEATISPGIISSIRKFADGSLLQFTAPISQGSSGGPVLNDRGQVVGVVSSYFAAGQNLNFAVPASQLSALMKRPSPPTAGRGRHPAAKRASPGVARGAASPGGRGSEGETPGPPLRPKSPAEELFEMGRAQSQGGRYEEAVGSFRQSVKLTPDYAPAYYEMGFALGQQGRWEEALQPLSRAAELSPNDWPAHYQMGLAYKNLGRWQAAVDSLKRALSLTGERYADYVTRIYAALGDAYFRDGKDDEAIRAFERVLYIRQDRASEATAQHDLGVIYTRQKKYAEGRAALGEALKLRPRSAETLKALGDLNFESGYVEWAANYYDWALDSDPSVGVMRDRLAASYVETAKYEKAAPLLEEELKLRPGDPALLYYSALNGIGLARLREAGEALRRAVSSDPDFVAGKLAKLYRDVEDRMMMERAGVKPDAVALGKAYRLAGVYLVLGKKEAGTLLKRNNIKKVSSVGTALEYLKQRDAALAERLGRLIEQSKAR
jgi:tetratricopeptide (TPR) repeat protein